MIEILRDLSGGDQKLPARQIFRSIISNQAREKLLITLLERAEINREKEPFYDDVIRAFHNLNKRRNKYVHGFWQTYEDGETVYLSAESVDDFHFLTARRVPIKELEKTIHDMDTLGQKLLNHFVSVLKSKSSPKKLPRRRGKAKT
jgi:hypothetical protein